MGTTNRNKSAVSTAYRWNITVLERNTYGDRIVRRTPAVVVASDRNDVTRQVRQMFNATYDDFRKFWSHDWTLKYVEAA